MTKIDQKNKRKKIKHEFIRDLLYKDNIIRNTIKKIVPSNLLRIRLKEMSNYQLSSNLSVGSKSNSGSSSKRSYEDLQSGCNGDNNIIYMLSGLVNTLIDQKNI